MTARNTVSVAPIFHANYSSWLDLTPLQFRADGALGMLRQTSSSSCMSLILSKSHHKHRSNSAVPPRSYASLRDVTEPADDQITPGNSSPRSMGTAGCCALPVASSRQQIVPASGLHPRHAGVPRRPRQTRRWLWRKQQLRGTTTTLA